MRTKKPKTKAQSWRSFRDQIARQYVGSFCENRRCGRVLAKGKIVVNHLVRRPHAPDLYLMRKNVRVTCGCDNDVDYDKRGWHTTNAERIRKIWYYFGERAAMWTKEEMENRGFMFDDAPKESEGVEL